MATSTRTDPSISKGLVQISTRKASSNPGRSWSFARKNSDPLRFPQIRAMSAWANPAL